MTDEITVDSEILISSKRASILSGYEQDYIGQLCRGGNIKARRVGGLWYVSADSLMKYKERAGEYKPEPPARNGEMHTPDSLVSFDGKGHISTTRAAKITGYSSDYVGQMARGGVIPSRQVGNRWYVEHAGILRHKESKDALLGAVQVESVGLKAQETPARAHDKAFSPPLYQYTGDKRHLFPAIEPRDEVFTYTKEEPKEEEEFVIPIHVRSYQGPSLKRTVLPQARRSMLPMLLPVGLLTVVIVLSMGFISLKRSSVYTSNSKGIDTNISQSASAGIAAVGRFADILETWIVPELVYKRKE